jgi:hypothetical protein
MPVPRSHLGPTTEHAMIITTKPVPKDRMLKTAKHRACRLSKYVSLPSRSLSSSHSGPPRTLCCRYPFSSRDRHGSFFGHRGGSGPRAFSLQLCPTSPLRRGYACASCRGYCSSPSSISIGVRRAESCESSGHALNLLGQPLMFLLQQLNYTSHICHLRTPSSHADCSASLEHLSHAAKD